MDADEALRLCKQLGHVDLIAEAYVALGRVQLAQQDFTGIEETLNEADRLSMQTSLDPWIAGWMDDCRVRFWLLTGKLNDAIQWVETNSLVLNGEFNYHSELPQIPYARVLVAQVTQKHPAADAEKVMDLLSRLLDATAKAGWVHHEIQVHILYAVLRFFLNDTAQALQSFERALNLAVPSGYVRTFIGGGELVRQLLHHAGNANVQPAYVERLLQEFDQSHPEQIEDSDRMAMDTSRTGMMYQLTERERDVLAELNTTLSIKEIAGVLCISVATLRTHIKHLYRKLGVHTRREAIARGYELGLI
jgi:LuxR family maltose regulon positive regulatory protein